METSPIDEIKSVTILGAGTMGSYFSLVVSLAGYETLIYDISDEALTEVPKRQKEFYPMFTGERKVPLHLLEAAAKRVRTTSDAEFAGKSADLIWETVPEILALKRKVLQQFDEICAPGTIFTSNTSTLLVSELEDCVKRGELFAAFHAYHRGTIIDIVGGARTSPDTIALLDRFSRSTNQLPIVLKKEKAGYLQNALMAVVVKEAILLVVDGYAELEDVDRSWMSIQNPRTGPFGFMDVAGLDVILNAYQAYNDRDEQEEYKKIISFLRSYVDKGHLGRKTGRGFYTYPEPAWEKPDFLAV